MADEAIPLASPAAFLPSAAPSQKLQSKVLTLDGEFGRAVSNRTEDSEAAPEAPSIDRLAALRDLARLLRAAPDSDQTLQAVIDEACRCTGSDAGMLTLAAPVGRQFVCGTALGAGPYISVPLRAGGPTFGEIVLTRLADGAGEYEAEHETFAELIAEYVAKAISTLRAGTVISKESQDFIDRISNDLRAPLAGAMATVGVATAAEGIPEDTLRYLRAAHGDLRRTVAAFDGLIMLAHLRPPKPTDMETIPVGPWLAAAVERVRPAAEDRGVTVTFREPADAYLVTGVRAQLDLVAGELLANAVKFTDPEGRVDVTAGVLEGEVKISVRDSGVGFDNSEAPRMTECFVRAITAEAGRYPGLGVGLFLAGHIVDNHGGRLWLESKRDEGTQAHVMLPQRHEGV